MSYHIMINTLGFEHPPFSCDDLPKALEKIEHALEGGLFAESGAQGFMAIQLGAGTYIRVMSDDAIREASQDRQMSAHNPLLMKHADAGNFKLAVQIGSNQLPALDFASVKDAETTIADAAANGVFRHTVRAEHEYLYVCTGPGTVYIVISAERYEEQRRRAIEARMRAVQQAQAAGGVILGPSGRPRN
jgi:hypothetical protein